MIAGLTCRTTRKESRASIARDKSVLVMAARSHEERTGHQVILGDNLVRCGVCARTAHVYKGKLKLHEQSFRYGRWVTAETF